MNFDFFLGASSPTGFAGFFDTLCDPAAPFRTCILKSGPGCGKSSLMKRVAVRAAAAGHDVETIHCSSDPDSLDGLVCRTLGFAFADGTAPHVLEPAVPAAGQEVLSLYDCIDAGALTPRLPSLLELFRANARCHERARRFIVAAGALYNETERTAQQYLLSEKAQRYAANLAARLFPKKEGAAGAESLRLLSAATPQGVVDYGPQNLLRCARRYVLCDRFGAAAHCILPVLRGAALDAGYDVISCRNPLAPYDKLDAVFVPELSVGFFWPAFGGFSGDGCRRIHDARFYDTAAMAAQYNRLRFCKRAARSLLDESCALLRQAKSVHDDIEDIYKRAVDFDTVRARENELCRRYGI